MMGKAETVMLMHNPSVIAIFINMSKFLHILLKGNPNEFAQRKNKTNSDATIFQEFMK